MNFYARGFNLYLLFIAVSLAAVCGCQSDKDKGAKHLALLRIHLENRAQVPGSGETVSVLRADPVLVTINTEPVLTEASIVSATLLDSPVGYAVEVKFDELGAYTLEQYTSAYQGKHFVIFGQWSEDPTNSRWLAAPLITHRIIDGVFAFTPDASHEEARQLVIGLNNLAKKIAKEKMK
jgi:preprotein translocase subunit SecD